MNPLVCLFALLATVQDAPKGPPTQPILRVEAGGHTAAVRDVAVDPKGRILATCSDDKSVRIWELPSLRLLRPPLGTTADEGKPYSLAISPDGTTVAVGGSTGYTWDGKNSVRHRNQGWRGGATDAGVAGNSVFSLAPLPGRGVAFATADGLGALGLDGAVRCMDVAAADLHDLGEAFRLTRNGAFTLAALECLAGKDRSGAVTITSLDAWIARRVKELTGGRQHPATQKPSTVRDFPIAVAGGKGS